MTPTLQDPFVWVNGRRCDLAHPEGVRIKCERCGQIADQHVFMHGDLKPLYRMDCTACGNRTSPGISGQALLDLVLHGAPAACKRPSDQEAVWVEWKKVRSKPGTGIGGKWHPAQVVPAKSAKSPTCRSCRYCSTDPEPDGRWCDCIGGYRSPSAAGCGDWVARARGSA